MPQVAEQTLTTEQFTALADLVYSHCGINLHDGKQEMVAARVNKQYRLRGFRSPTDYLQRVMNNPGGEEFTKLIDALSTNLTSFFRESDHFDYLAETLLPNLMARKTAVGSQRIRAWCAGCSTGEEAYSLAMVLHAVTGGLAKGWDVKLLATDISTRVLGQAERGTYNRRSISSIPPAMTQRYMTVARGGNAELCEIVPDLRDLISFRYLNLMEQWPFSGPFDFIFCRNVMIYFDKPTQQTLVGRFHGLLAPGGLLFTGHSESLTGIRHRFNFIQPSVYARIEDIA